MTIWKRCGNSDFYYRKGHGLEVSFVNPFTLTNISVAQGQPRYNDVGSLSILYRKARKYSLKALASGLSEYASTDDEKQMISSNMRGWVEDLDMIHEGAIDKNDVRQAFKEAPPEFREAVLHGVLSLLAGLGNEEMQNFSQQAHLMDAEMNLVIEKGSPAESNLREIELNYTVVPPSRIVEDLAAGLDEVLAGYGIYEC